MRVSHDIFSETNPAFGLYALVSYTDGILFDQGGGPRDGDRISLNTPSALRRP